MVGVFLVVNRQLMVEIRSENILLLRVKNYIAGMRRMVVLIEYMYTMIDDQKKKCMPFLGKHEIIIAEYITIVLFDLIKYIDEILKKTIIDVYALLMMIGGIKIKVNNYITWMESSNLIYESFFG